jgi:hypothetical protein
MGKRKFGDCVNEDEGEERKHPKPSAPPPPELASFWQDIQSACKGSLSKHYYSSYYQ